LGQTKSLNVGLRIANGKYVARTDAGDFSLPTRLKKQVSHFEKHPEMTVLGTSAFRYDEGGRVIDVVSLPNSPASIFQRIFFASPTVHISVLMDRETILDIGGYDEDYCILADYELWSRLLQNGYRIANIKEVLAGYMVSPESLGNVNALGRSIIEASKIIQKNVSEISSTSISLQQAENLYRLLALNLSELSMVETVESENLIYNILQKINVSRKDIDFILMRSYIKYVLSNIEHPTNKLKCRHAMRYMFTKIGCLLSFTRLSEPLSRLFQSMLWRFKSGTVTFNS
jgi:glycosyltransferase involved in cell wall biosynthesis